MEERSNQPGCSVRRPSPTGMDVQSNWAVTSVRIAVQCCFLLWVIDIGIRFGLFTEGYEY